MLSRLADVTTFHHALSAWRTPEIFAKRGIGVATFADLSGSTNMKLGYNDSMRSPSILHSAGE